MANEFQTTDAGHNNPAPVGTVTTVFVLILFKMGVIYEVLIPLLLGGLG